MVGQASRLSMTCKMSVPFRRRAQPAVRSRSPVFAGEPNTRSLADDELFPIVYSHEIFIEGAH